MAGSRLCIIRQPIESTCCRCSSLSCAVHLECFISGELGLFGVLYELKSPGYVAQSGACCDQWSQVSRCINGDQSITHRPAHCSYLASLNCLWRLLDITMMKTLNEITFDKLAPLFFRIFAALQLHGHAGYPETT